MAGIFFDLLMGAGTCPDLHPCAKFIIKLFITVGTPGLEPGTAEV